MGYRLSKIYTKTGDQGTTALSDNQRIAKSDEKIIAIGAIDELNATIGLVITYTDIEPISDILITIQHDLFNAGAEVSMPDYHVLTPNHIHQLEQWIDHFNADLPALKEFILPGGAPAAAFCHQARTIARRCETQLVTMCHHQASLQQRYHILLQYINRLSDLLFVTARTLNHATNTNETLWQSHRVTKNQG